MEQQSKAPKADFLAKAAFLFGTGTLTSRILGLIRDSLLFSLMPLDMKDAWFAAFRLPNFFRRLLGEGGLSVSFIPIYVDQIGHGDKKAQQELASGVWSLLLFLTSMICVLTFIFMDSIITYWLSGPGFAGVPGKIEMTITMAKIMVFFLFFITQFAFLMALMNSLQKFTLTGFAPVMMNVVIIAALFYYRDDPRLPEASSWAVLIGGAMQALLLVPSVYYLGVFPRLTWRWRNLVVLKVLKRFLPTIFGVGVLQILTMANTYFASQLQSGAISYIYLGDRLLELPLSLVAVSIGTALLPTLSKYWNTNQKSLFLECISQHMALFNFLALPAAFGLWFLGFDIIDVLFSRGEFKANEVPIVAKVLKIYCVTLMTAGSLRMITQAFYAFGDTVTPAIVSVIGLVIHLATASLWMEYFGINGLVLSTALITLVNLCICFVILQKRVGWLDWKYMSAHFVRCLVACSVMGLFLWSLRFLHWKQGKFILDFPILIAFIAAAGLIFFAMASLLDVSEMNMITRKIRGRLKKK